MLILLIFVNFLFLADCKSLSKPVSADFDLLIFTQVWPSTSCYEWKEKSPKHKCNLPSNEEWSIHGLWPTKNGTMGPFFCNQTRPFDIDTLASLKAQLEIKWIDIHKGSKSYEFWKHEWDKHGTCALELEQLNSEKKYFQKAIDLLDEYDMKHVLAKANMVPNKQYLLQEYLDGIHKILGKNAYIECTQNNKRGEIFVSEIRICLSRQLELTDCNGILHYPSNCDRQKEIIYPGSVPDLLIHPSVNQI